MAIAGGSEDRRDDGPDGRSPGPPEPGRDGGEVDIRAGHCTLPSAMPEAKPPEELPRFDEDQPRPVPSLQLQDGTTLSRLVGVMRRLLAPDGCPWDREQTFETLRKYVL